MKPIHPDNPSMGKAGCLQLALGQRDLARELDVSDATVNRWENGQSKASKLAHVQVDAFCRGQSRQEKLKTTGVII